MTSPTGRSDFTDDIKSAGGVQNLAKTNYARNMWYIMREFKSLPAVGGFANLSSRQVEFILAERDIDDKEEEAALHGQAIDYDKSFSDNDDDWFEHPENIKEQTPEEIQSTREQLAALMDRETAENLNNNYAKLDRMMDNEAKNPSAKIAEKAVDEKYQGLLDLIDNGSPDDIREYRNSLNGRSQGKTPSSQEIDNRLSGKEE